MKGSEADVVVSDLESPFLPSSQAPQHHARKKPLTLLPLIALIFFEVTCKQLGVSWSRRLSMFLILLCCCLAGFRRPLWHRGGQSTTHGVWLHCRHRFHIFHLAGAPACS
eukprot:GHRR01015243.1.p1 GENE.GHRR01015243.1~~GHRR01015243.1.p1  ORF type:complete len:110 (+),score=11.22 GHRR01015243.1:278-607(+)